MRTYVYKCDPRDPFARLKEEHEEERRRLNREIIRLKIKCGEAFSSDELLFGFANPPEIYMGRRTFEEHKAAGADLTEAAG